MEHTPAVLPHRERADAMNRILTVRYEELLPGPMREVGLDMWIVINPECAEDAAYLTLAPAPAYAARRTTILGLFDRGEGKRVERLTVSWYGQGEYFQSAWPEGGTKEEL